MSITKHTAYGAIQTALSTDLNSVANNGTNAAATAVDNSANADMFMDLELLLAITTARSANATVEVYMTFALDGTNYTDLVQSIMDPIAIVPLDAATTARRLPVIHNLPIQPVLMKFWITNKIGVAFAASGNTLRYRTHNISTT